ncbi:MAG: HD domain-containing protein [Thermodesulfobacteriota bacterium]|nr:HD domain-containing protein [Desulfovibrionales bacterium]MDQ7837329.1 HD domain-containing protein [Thermodesulfobacteriota bacterium]
MKRIAKLLFEAGMLKKTPRTGFRFLGSGQESVADHSYRVILIGYVLAGISPGVDRSKVMELCLFHDLVEARTGDLNYVYKDYATVDSAKAVAALTKDLDFGEDIAGLITEFKSGHTEEAKLARDADQLDLILELKEQHDLGNKFAREWLAHVVKRITTPAGQELAGEILETDFCSWWFDKYRGR